MLIVTVILKDVSQKCLKSSGRKDILIIKIHLEQPENTQALTFSGYTGSTKVHPKAQQKLNREMRCAKIRVKNVTITSPLLRFIR